MFIPSLILELIKKNPTSRFLNHSFEKICISTPHLVKRFPPCTANFEAFISVLRTCIMLANSVESNSQNLEKIISILICDDLTVFFTAQHIDRNNNLPLIHIIQKSLSDQPALHRLFQNSLLRLEGCLDEDISILFHNDLITPESIDRLVQIPNPSAYLQELILFRLESDLFNPKLPEPTLRKLIESLVCLTNSDANLEFIMIAANYIKIWKVDLAVYLTHVTYSIQFHFFSEALISKLRYFVVKGTNHSAHSPNFPSPIRQILCEISYQHHDLIPQIVDMIKDAVVSKRQFSTYFDLIADLFNVLSYIFGLGFPIQVLQVFARKSDNDSCKRNALVNMLRSCSPPYTQEFLHEMLECLTSEYVKPLFFPKNKGSNTINVKPLEALLFFVEQLNRDENTRTLQKDAYVYDDLRREARRLVEIGKNRTQHTLNCFF
ncbi:hypothetical protein GPJ56_010114 [Histomonas meleagridis]|uniref:uncharacterized protein n=1 Tax=Histomonas meleagridis TaxID=135588 RepID=UPI00355A6DA0|nr:hypothetical protein GPJ56_010114 [Histomonas meleagridis]KAH0806770.1 hypothetical protein GO595_000413 [Histomonas meleagridis]